MVRTKVEFRIDQTLHGYRHGHKLLAGSLKLEPRGEALMLALSDLLTSTSLGSNDSYLSGYPLKDSNKYVLARTWAAPESSRPGSVWTHSLVLDYAGLAVIEDLSVLLSLFSRPEIGNEKRYEKSISSAAFSNAVPHKIAIGSSDRAFKVLKQLYRSNAKSNIDLPITIREQDEGLSVALWRQLWPRLRRDFAFFSCATGSITDVVASCVLTFQTDSTRLREIEDGTADSTFASLLADLPQPGPTPLRHFLARYAHDAADPRGVVPSLVDIFESSTDPISLVSTFSNSLSNLWGLPRLKRDILMRAVNAQDESAVLQIVHLFKNEPIFSSEAEFSELVSLSYDRKPDWLGHLFEAALPSQKGQLGHAVIDSLSRKIESKMLARIPTSESAKELILRINPGVVKYSEFWPADVEDRGKLLEAAIDVDVAVEDVLDGLWPVITPSEIHSLVVHADDDAAAKMIARLLSVGDAEKSRLALRVLISRPALFEKVLLTEELPQASLLDAFAAEVLENSSYQVVKPKAWSQILDSLAGIPDTAKMNVLVCGFLSSDNGARESGDLLKKTFDPIYAAADRYRLSRICRDALERFTAESREWGLTAKIIGKAITILGGAGHPDIEILDLTSSRSVFLEIVRQIQKSAGKEALAKLLARSKKSRAIQHGKCARWLREFLETKRTSWLF